MKEITREDIIKFGAHLKEHYIPIENNQVPYDFISFVLNCHNDVFFDYFDIVSEEDISDSEVKNIIRKEVSISLINEISQINNDFFHRSLEQNSFLDLEKIIYSLGFEKLDTFHFASEEKINKEEAYSFIDNIEDRPINVHFKEQGKDINAIIKERMSYYYNIKHGLLWEIQTHSDHYISHSVLYGNIRKKSVKQADLKDMNSYRLNYSTVYGFKIDMKVLPIYKFDNLIMEYKFIRNWLALPEPDFKESRYFYGLANKYQDRITVPNTMVDSLVENFGDDFFNTEEQDFLFSMFVEEFPSIKENFLLIDILFDGCMKPEHFEHYLNSIGRNEFWDNDKLSTCVYLYFKNLNVKDLKHYKKDETIIKLLEHFERKHIQKLYDKREVFVNTFKLSDIVLSYIELRLNDKKLH